MLWPFSLAESLPSWVILILTVVDLAIRVLALGIIPGNRRPTTAMAWLLIIFFVPAVGLVLFLLFGNFRLSRKRRAQQDAVNTRVRAGTSELAMLESRYEGPEWVSSAAELNKTLGSLPMVDGNQRGAPARLPGLDQGDGGRGPQSGVLRQRRVLHSELGPRHGRSADRDGRGRRARRRSPPPVRPPGHPAHQGLQQADRPAQGEQDPLAAHAAAATRARAVAPPGPAQPPQDHGDRRRGRLHRVAEPDRARPTTTRGTARWAASGSS